MTKAPEFALPQIAHTDVRDAVLTWYDGHRRTLPWRAVDGETPDPYAVWMSEIMLQQTTVATVGPYFQRFTETWPTVVDLANASLDDVLVAWQGLGYYARARNLHKCAGVVRDDWEGEFPQTVDELRTLPGIGPYTASAIAAIAFDQPAVPIDGNIERVLARLFAINVPLPAAKKPIGVAAELFVSRVRPGDFAQAMMDLGATVCTPTSPKCLICPLQKYCAGTKSGSPERLPVKAPKKAKPRRRAVVFWITDERGRVLLRRRAERGLLGGMMEFPSTPWVEGDWPSEAEITDAAPVSADWARMDGTVQHTFTHFHLHLRVARAQISNASDLEATWAHPDDFPGFALPTVMKKVARHALDVDIGDDN